MDKLVLNTEIVSMRHEVRRARVHTINKLIRTARKLNSKNGSEKDKEKFQRKAARLMEEINIMKALKDDEVSKYSLIKKKEPTYIIADPTKSIKERALARLSCHSSIVSRVKQFRMKFPTWDGALPHLLTQMGTKSKKKKEKVKKKKITGQKNSKSHILDREVSNSADSGCEEGNKETSSEIEDLQSASKVPTLQVKKSKAKGEYKLISSDHINLSTKVPNKTLAEVKKFSEVFSNSENNDILKVNNRDFEQDVNDSGGGDDDDDDIDNNNDGNKIEMKHRNVHDNFREKKHKDYSNDDDDGGGGDHHHLNVKNDSLSAKVVDPFFVCEDGETSYLSSVQKNETEDREHTKFIKQSSWKRDIKRVYSQGERERHVQLLRPKKSSYGDINQREHNKQFHQWQKKDTQNRNRNQSGHDNKLFHQRHNKNAYNKKDIPVQGNESIHPSWEAKRKLKEQQHAVSAFQGKKIKFED